MHQSTCTVSCKGLVPVRCHATCMCVCVYVNGQGSICRCNVDTKFKHTVWVIPRLISTDLGSSDYIWLIWNIINQLHVGNIPTVRQPHSFLVDFTLPVMFSALQEETDEMNQFCFPNSYVCIDKIMGCFTGFLRWHSIPFVNALVCFMCNNHTGSTWAAGNKKSSFW